MSSNSKIDVYYTMKIGKDSKTDMTVVSPTTTIQDSIYRLIDLKYPNSITKICQQDGFSKILDPAVTFGSLEGDAEGSLSLTVTICGAGETLRGVNLGN
jgi:hypothetical protein